MGTKKDSSKHAFIPTGKPSTKVFQLPDGTRTPASDIQQLHHNVRQPAKDVHIVPTIDKNSLLSIPKFAAAGYITVFDGEEVNIYDAYNTKVIVTREAILRGWFDKTANLWRVPLLPIVLNETTNTVLVYKTPTEYLPDRPPPIDAVHNVYELKTQPELICYLHVAAGFPTKPTWLAAIKNKHYASWLGLTTAAVAKYYPESEETMKGHGRKERSGLRSTKTTEQPLDPLRENNVERQAPIPKEYDVFIKVIAIDEEGNATIHSDQTGRFPKKSSRGNQYIMVLVHPNSNGILQEPMKNRTSGKMIRAYQNLINRLKSAGITPKHHILDNECSADFKQTIRDNNMTYQLVPPHDHRRNMAEKAIQTFKAHFISILCGADKDFPLHLWDRLLPQAEHTLNMLRRSKVTPTVSAFAYLWGQHNYNANPFTPLGCKVEAHVTPGTRETWAAHTTSGYYIGNAWEHYRCHEVYVSSTKATCVCETVFFRHKYLTMPTITPADALIKAVDNLVDVITGQLLKNSVTADAVEQLMEIYKLQAKKATCDARAQRVLRETAQAQRVAEEQSSTTTSQAFPQVPAPIISQDDDSPPAENTRQQRQVCTLT